MIRGRWRDRHLQPKHDRRLRGSKCPWAKLTEEDIIAIRTDKESSLRALAARFNVVPSTIWHVKKNKTHYQ
jgi:hypothetical protein